MYIDRLPKNILNKLKTIEQPIQWHPERTVYNHIYLVEKEAQKYNDSILEMCAVFHDLGKIDAVQWRGNKNVFYGHQLYSLQYIDKYKHLFDDVKNVNWDIVKWVVLNHMRSHVLDQMRPTKRKKIMEHPWFSYLLKFSDCDNNGRGEMDDLEVNKRII